MTPESFGHVYWLPRLGNWSDDKLPRRRGNLVLQRWICAGKHHRPMVVRESVLRAVLRSVRKRNPSVVVRSHAIEVQYDRGRICLHLHDATEVLGKLFHFHLQQQPALTPPTVHPLELAEVEELKQRTTP